MDKAEPRVGETGPRVGETGEEGQCLRETLEKDVGMFVGLSVMRSRNAKLSSSGLSDSGGDRVGHSNGSSSSESRSSEKNKKMMRSMHIYFTLVTIEYWLIKIE